VNRSRDTAWSVLTEGAGRSQSGTAFRRGDDTLSYDQLEAASRALAHGLLALGLDTGDKVALSLENDFLYPVAFFGIQRAGGVVVPLNPGLTARERSYILGHSDARWMICAGGKAPEADSEACPAFEGALRVDVDGSIEGRARSTGEEGRLPVADPDREGILIYTSGTTGVPKGVLLTQANIVSNARSVVTYLDLGPEDRHAVFLPLFYSYAMSQMLSTLLAGGEVVLFDDLLYPALVLREMAAREVTVVAGVPTTYNLFVRLTGFRAERFPSLRICLNAGGPIHPDRLEQLRERFPGAKIINNYGCTEAGPRVTFLPHDEVHRRGSIGRAIPGLQVMLRDEAGRIVGPGELGELTVTGPSVMKRYYKNELETRRVLTPQGLRTGDWATVDSDGYFYFKGRKVDIINTGGEKVSAREVEEVLAEHPGVHEVAVVGAADPILGEVVRAFVVPEVGAAVSEDDLIRFARVGLAHHKVPRQIVFTNRLARTPSGKIRKVDLV